ncbi:MAG: hypothetical protein HY755_12970 [Nitrospirae bacterium]|nr:hypothetical protein [Nitrospirota bacterium]
MKRVILSVLIILISVISQVSYASILLDKVVAVVNQEVITWSDLYKAMEFEVSDRMQGMNSEERRKIFKENEGIFS